LNKLKGWLNTLNIVNKQGSKSHETLKWSDLQLEWDLSKDKNKKLKHYNFQPVSPSRGTDRDKKRLTIEDHNYRDDPFSGRLHGIILSNISNTLDKREGYYYIDSSLPGVNQKNQIISIPPHSYTVQEFKAKGAHGRIFRATINDTEAVDTSDLKKNEKDIILKVQQPRREWEFYIAAELQIRLEENDRKWFVTIPQCYTFNDGSIFTEKKITLVDESWI